MRAIHPRPLHGAREASPEVGREPSAAGLSPPCTPPSRHDAEPPLPQPPTAPPSRRSSKCVTQTSCFDFLFWSISLPSSCLLTFQNESLSLEISSGAGDPDRRGRRRGTAHHLGEGLWARPSSGGGPGRPAGINARPPPSRELLPGSLQEGAEGARDVRRAPTPRRPGRLELRSSAECLPHA